MLCPAPKKLICMSKSILQVTIFPTFCLTICSLYIQIAVSGLVLVYKIIIRVTSLPNYIYVSNSSLFLNMYPPCSSPVAS